MPLDPSIFYNYAALNQRRNENLVDSFGQNLRDMQNYKLKKEEEKAKGLDLEKLAQQAVYKTEMGGKATPEEEAAFKAYQKFESAKQGVDPNTGELYPKFRSFELGSQSGPKGFDISILPPSARQAPQNAPMGVPAMSDDDFLNTPVTPLKTSGAPLNMGMLEGDALPQIPRETGGFDLGALQQPVSDALPQVGLPAPSNPIQEKANYQARLDIAKDLAKEKGKTQMTLGQEEEKKSIGRQKFDSTVQLLVDRLGELQKMGGMSSAGQGGLQSAKSYISGTGLGQEAGRLTATQEQAIRDEINSLRLGLKSALKDATGMTAQEMNSNVELQTFLDSITNPRSTYEANYNMAANLSKLYGTGAIERIQPQAPLPEGKRVRQKSTGRTGRIVNGEFVPD